MRQRSLPTVTGAAAVGLTGLAVGLVAWLLIAEEEVVPAAASSPPTQLAEAALPPHRGDDVASLPIPAPTQPVPLLAHHHEGDSPQQFDCLPEEEAKPLFADPEAALQRLRQVVPAWPGPLGDPDRLSALSEHLIIQLHAGGLDPADLVRFLGRETEPVMLDLMAGALLAFEPGLAQAGVPEALMELAQSIRLDRRRTAALLLGVVPDSDGGVRQTLLQLAHSGDGDVDLAAIAALADRGRRDPAETGPVQAELAGLLTEIDSDLARAQVLGTLDLRHTPQETVAAVGQVLRSGAPMEVRFAAISALGSAGPAHRTEVLLALESAYGREPDPGLRAAMLHELVRVGRTGSVATLERLVEADPLLRDDIADYVVILEGGEMDLPIILEQKARRQIARAGGR